MTLTKSQIELREDTFFLLCIAILLFFTVLLFIKISLNYLGVIS